MSDVGFAGVANFAMTSTATAVRVMGVAGVGGGSEVVAGPSFGLNFVTSSFDGPTLDSRITFSRTTNATLIGSNGQLQYAPHNLLTYSEQFDDAVWAKSNTTVNANNVVAPDGTTTADKLVEDTATSTHNISASTAFAGNSQTVLSVYLKAGERTSAIVRLRDAANNANLVQAVFDLSNGTAGTATNGGTGSGALATITSVGNGWYRCVVSGNLNTTGNAQANIRIQFGGNDSYTGDGTSGIYVWGAQLNVGALQPYYSTTVKNLLGYSQEFNDAAWSKTNSTITADVTAAPDGSVTADKLVEDTSAAIGHFISPVGSPALVVGQVVTYSVYAKAAERTFLQLILTSIGPAGANLVAGFDLTTGLVGTPSATLTSSMVAVGNGWYRCRITVLVATAGSPLRQIRISQNASSTPSSYTGDGTSGIYIWGAQFSDSASLDPYVYNPGAAPSNTAYYGPRFDYDPVTLAAKGLLIEEQRTNSIRNNTMQGAVVGTPGTLPTNWLKVENSSLSFAVVEIGTEDGIAYVDVRLSGTASAGTGCAIEFEQTGYLAASVGQTWTLTSYAKIIGGSTAGINDVRFGWQERAAGFLASNFSIVTLQTGQKLSTARLYHVGTNANASTTSIKPYIFFTPANGAAIDITVRIGMPQIELGAFATSVIPTTTTALTRAADVASVTGANFSSWFNSVEGTLLTTTLALNQTLAPNRYVSTMDDGTTNNIIGAYIDTSLNATSFVVNGGVAVYQEVIATVSNTLPNSIAVTYKANNFMSAANGVLGIPDTSGNVPVVNKITFGNRSDGARPLNGHIRSFKYYPIRLSNAELQALTT